MGHLKNFITLLPGPQSYCKCTSLCSQLTIEHVVPKSLFKRSGLSKGLANDLHNIYPCCQRLNGDKGSLLFGKDFLFSTEQSHHTGALARTCLFMYDKYDLPIDNKTVTIWKKLNEVCLPYDFEVVRNEIIYKKTGVNNPYLIDHLENLLENEHD